MKLTVISPDANGTIDGTLQQFILSQLPTGDNGDAVVVPIAYHGNYRFNHHLSSITKPIVVLDFLEMGWEAGEKENRLGTGMTRQFQHLHTEEYLLLEQWAREHPARLTFKRELRRSDVSETMLPAEFPCCPAVPSVQSKAEFDARPFDLCHIWGYSNPSRSRLHGKIFQAMGDSGLNVISDWSQFPNLPPTPPKSVVSIYSPYWCRQPMSRVYEVQQKCKIAVSLFGAGRKSFRDAESCCGSLMARPADGLAWSHPWNEQNSIQLRSGEEFEGLMAAVNRDDLYELYRACQDNARHYQSDAYAKEYLLAQISKVL